MDGPGDDDEDGLQSYVLARTDSAPEAEREVKVHDARVRRADEALRVEHLRVSEHLRVFRYRADPGIDESAKVKAKSEKAEKQGSN